MAMGTFIRSAMPFYHESLILGVYSSCLSLDTVYLSYICSLQVFEL